MQRRLLLTALIAAIMLAILISAAAMAQKNAPPPMVAGTQECTPPGPYVYDPITGHSYLTDSVMTCTLTAVDANGSLMPMVPEPRCCT